MATKKEIPDPAAFMESMLGPPAGAGPAGYSGPMTPGASGKTMPTQTSGALQGQATPKGPPVKHGQTSGKSKPHGGKGLHPNNTKKAGSSTKGKAHHMPSMNAVNTKIHNSLGSPSRSGSNPRSGILSKFEGFGKQPSNSNPSTGGA